MTAVAPVQGQVTAGELILPHRVPSGVPSTLQDLHDFIGGQIQALQMLQSKVAVALQSQQSGGFSDMS